MAMLNLSGTYSKFCTVDMSLMDLETASDRQFIGRLSLLNLMFLAPVIRHCQTVN